MAKLNAALALLLLLCALAAITAQHQARRLFSELTREQEVARQIDVEWGRLQLEQSTWAMHGRIEKIATGQLQMQAPAPARLRLVTIEGPDGSAAVAAMPANRSESAHRAVPPIVLGREPPR